MHPTPADVEGLAIFGSHSESAANAVNYRGKMARQKVSTLVYTRSAFIQRQREIMEALSLDKGGADRCSESLKQLISRFATASALAEQFEAQMSLGQKIDVAAYSQLCNVLSRIVKAVGIDGAKFDSEPRLVDLLRSQDKE
jgi:hypothetical protein